MLSAVMLSVLAPFLQVKSDFIEHVLMSVPHLPDLEVKAIKLFSLLMTVR
jgi:hypothetical protein